MLIWLIINFYTILIIVIIIYFFITAVWYAGLCFDFIGFLYRFFIIVFVIIMCRIGFLNALSVIRSFLSILMPGIGAFRIFLISGSIFTVMQQYSISATHIISPYPTIPALWSDSNATKWSRQPTSPTVSHSPSPNKPTSIDYSYSISQLSNTSPSIYLIL